MRLWALEFGLGSGHVARSLLIARIGDWRDLYADVMFHFLPETGLSGRVPIGVVLACLFLTSCSATDLVNGLTPEDGYRIESGIAFGENERQKLDIYTPDEPREGAPLVVFFYGGGWDSGFRGDYKFVGEAFAAEGYVTAIPDYRLYPEVGWKGFMSDAARSVAAVMKRYPEIAAGGRSLVLAGHSAGAYIAAMLALDASWLAGEDVEPCHIGAVIGLSGPYDFLPLRDDRLRAIFGPGPASVRTQPVHHVDRDDPPMLLITGLEDETVLPRNTDALADALAAVDIAVDVRMYGGVDHVDVVAAMSRPVRFLAPTHDDVFGYLAQHPTAVWSTCEIAGR